MQEAIVVREREVNLRMGQCESGDRLGAVSQFGAYRTEKLSPYGRVKEEIGDRNRRAHCSRDRFHAADCSAINLQFGSRIAVGCSAADIQMGNRAN